MAYPGGFDGTPHAPLTSTRAAARMQGRFFDGAMRAPLTSAPTHSLETLRS